MSDTIPRPAASAVVTMASAGAEQLSLQSLSLPQLQKLREQLEVDMNKLTESMSELQQAVNRFHTSGVALEQLTDEEIGASTHPSHVTCLASRLPFVSFKRICVWFASLYIPYSRAV